MVQGSASSLPVVREIAFFDGRPDASTLQFALHRARLFLSWFPAVLYYSGIGSLWYVMALATGGAFVFSRATRAGERHRLGLALWELAPLAVAVLCLGFAHKFVRLATREWYYVSSDLLLALAWGVLVHFLMRCAKNRRARYAIFIPIACATAFFLGYKTRARWIERSERPLSYFLEIVDAVDRLPDLAPSEPVGVTDSGTVGFFCPRPAINLDGVVNPEAARAIRQGALLRYCEEKEIRYLIVTPRMYNARVFGEGFEKRLILYPPLTPQGYRISP